MNRPSFEFHVHPMIKPFCHACKKLLKHQTRLKPKYFSREWLKKNHPSILEDFFNPHSKASLWNDKRPRRLLNRLFGELAFAKFSQSNLTAAREGNCHLMSISLYPIEKEFLSRSCDQQITGIPLFKNIVTGISNARIKYIQGAEYSYFEDTCAQYEYLKTSAELSRGTDREFILAADFSAIKKAIRKKTGAVIGFLSIEGANVFYPSKKVRSEDIDQILKNIETVKNWEHVPLMVSLAHHFYNGFVSHEESLVKLVRNLGNIDQSRGCNEELSDIPGFHYCTSEGLRVIDKLLDTSCGRRILIDMKHIDYRGRREYYQFIKEKYQNQIPVVFSHAAVGEDTDEKWFNPWTINLNNHDIKAAWKTKGLIGLELDQRILGFNEYLRYCKKNNIEIKRQSPEFNAALIWNAARHIAGECAGIIHSTPDEERTNAWSCISIGSDYDGLINPVNGYPTVRYFNELEKQLIKLAKDFLNEPPRLLHRFSPDSAIELVEGIMTTHGMQFLKNNYQKRHIGNNTSYFKPKPVLS
jgi:hypothetical protein